MSQPESQLSRKIMTALRARNVFCFKVHGGPTMTAGLPDIIACVDGKFVGFETKLPSARNNVSGRQKFIHDQIREAGGSAFVVCSAREALQIVRDIREHDDQGDMPDQRSHYDMD